VIFSFSFLVLGVGGGEWGMKDDLWSIFQVLTLTIIAKSKSRIFVFEILFIWYALSELIICAWDDWERLLNGA
jgi:hypothetical protein